MYGALVVPTAKPLTTGLGASTLVRAPPGDVPGAGMDRLGARRVGPCPSPPLAPEPAQHQSRRRGVLPVPPAGYGAFPVSVRGATDTELRGMGATMQTGGNGLRWHRHNSA